MKEGEQQVLASFDKCPVCGSERRLMGELVKEQKEKGKMPEDTQACLQLLSAAAFSPMSAATTLIGEKVPTGTAILDACLDCGTVYAVQLLRGEVRLQIQQMPMQGQQMGPGMGFPNMGPDMRFPMSGG